MTSSWIATSAKPKTEQAQTVCIIRGVHCIWIHFNYERIMGKNGDSFIFIPRLCVMYSLIWFDIFSKDWVEYTIIYYCYTRCNHSQESILFWQPQVAYFIKKAHDDVINGNIFRAAGHLCGEFSDDRWIPAQRPMTRSFDVFFDLRLNKRLS